MDELRHSDQSFFNILQIKITVFVSKNYLLSKLILYFSNVKMKCRPHLIFISVNSSVSFGSSFATTINHIINYKILQT